MTTTVPVKKYLNDLIYGEGRIRIYCEEGKPAIVMKNNNEPTLAHLLQHMAPPPHTSRFSSCLWQIVAEASPRKMEALIKQLAKALRAANKNRRANERPRIGRRAKALLRPDDRAAVEEMIAKGEVSENGSEAQAFQNV